MKININEFRPGNAKAVEAPLDFTTLCSLLAAHQAATPTAKAARDETIPVDQGDHGNSAVAALLAGTGHGAVAPLAHGSFHAAAARVSGENQ